MADENDTSADDDGRTEKEQLEQAQEFLEDRGIEESSVDEKLDDLEGQREQEQELAELKIRVAEAEDAGIGDDPAIQRVREQIDALQQELDIGTEPTPEEEREERREILERRKKIAERHELDDLAEDIAEELDALSAGGEVGTYDDVDAYSADPATRAEAKLSHLKQKLEESGDEEALDAFQSANFAMNFAAAGGSAGERRAAAKRMADLAEEHGVDLSEIRPNGSEEGR